MKVAELIKLLKKMPQDAKVIVVESVFEDGPSEERTPNLDLNFNGEVEL